jgi:hypothetical protein
MPILTPQKADVDVQFYIFALLPFAAILASIAVRMVAK